MYAMLYLGEMNKALLIKRQKLGLFMVLLALGLVLVGGCASDTSAQKSEESAVEGSPAPKASSTQGSTESAEEERNTR